MLPPVAWLQSALARFWAPLRDRPVSAGSAGAMPVRPEYSRLTAMSTMGRFPWVVVCVRAKAGDLAGLPLVAVQRRGSVEEVLHDHPVTRLLRRPSPWHTGLQLRRQIYADFTLSGSAYIHRPASHLLHRLHPHLTEPEVLTDTGELLAWRYNHDRRLRIEDVLSVQDISWATQAHAILGESVIRALHDSLMVESQTHEMTRKQSSRGRPELLLRPKSEDAEVDPRARALIEQQWEEFARSGRGAFVISSFFEAQPLNLTPREMEFAQLRHDNRDTILAVFEVPPARAGLASANYGTQKQQMRTYWESLLNGMGALFDDAYSLMTGSDDVAIRHDRTNIEALQLSYTERQLRAERWVTIFGAKPREAAEYEGFHNPPVGEWTGKTGRPPASEPDEPQRQTADILADYLRGAAERYQRRILDADGDADQVRAHGEESLRVLVELERLGLPQEAALWWADEVATLADESAVSIATDAWGQGVTRVGIEHLAAFGRSHAEELAQDIEQHREAA